MRVTMGLLRRFNLSDLIMASQEVARDGQIHDPELRKAIAEFRRKFETEYSKYSYKGPFDAIKAADAIAAAMPVDITTNDAESLYKLKLMIDIIDPQKQGMGGELIKLSEFQNNLSTSILEKFYRNGILPGIFEILRNAKADNINYAEITAQIEEIIKDTLSLIFLDKSELKADDIYELRSKLEKVASAAENRTHLLLAADALEGLPENFIAKVKRDKHRLMDTAKARQLIVDICAAIEEQNFNKAIIAFHTLNKYVYETVGVLYQGGFKTATQKKILDFNMDDYTSLFMSALGHKVDDLSIPDSDFFRAFAESVVNVYSDNADEAARKHYLFNILSSLKNGCQLFEKALRSRGLPQKPVYDKSYNDTVEDFTAKLNAYDKTLATDDTLVKHILQKIPLWEMDRYIDSTFALAQEKLQFKKKLTDYMIEHAYEIHEWQMLLNAEPRLAAYVDAKLPQKNAQDIPDVVAGGNNSSQQTQQTDKMKERILPRSNQSLENSDASLERVDRRDVQGKINNNDHTSNMRKKILNDVMNEHEAEIQQISGIICEHFVKNVTQLIIDSRDQWKVGRIGGKDITINVDGHEHRVRVPKNVYKIFQLCQKAERDNRWKTHFNEIARIGLEASKPHRFDFFGLTKRDELTQQFYDKFKQAYIEKDAEIVRHRAKGG